MTSKKLGEIVYEDFKASAKFKKSLHARWKLHNLMYAGNQWIDLTFNRDRIMPLEPEEHRTRLVINHIASYVTKMLAKILATIPGKRVVPGDNEATDQNISQVADSWLTYYQNKTDFDNKRQDNILNLLLFGNSFMRPYWNPAAGIRKPLMKPVFKTDEAGNEEPVYDENGSPEMVEALDDFGVPTLVSEGDIEVEVISPFLVHVNMDSTCWDEVRWLIEARPRHVDWIRKHYNFDAAPEDVNTDIEDVYRPINNYDTDTDSPNREMAIVLEGYYLPSRDNRFPDVVNVPKNDGTFEQIRTHEQGFYVVVINQKVVFIEPIPQIDANKIRLPHYFFGWEKVPLNFWHMSPIQHGIPLQQEINFTRSAAADIRKIMLNPKWLVPKGCGLGPNAITNKPGEIIEYKAYDPGTGANTKPEMIASSDIPQGFHTQYSQALYDFQDVMHFHDQTQGKSPAGVRSGSQLQMLQSSDDAFLRPITDRIKVNEKGLFKDILNLAKLYEKEELFRSTDDVTGIRTRQFIASDLGDGFDIVLVDDISKTMNRGERIQTLMNLITIGLLDPQRDRERILKIMQLGIDPRDEYADKRRWENLAEAENETLSQGIYIAPVLFEDHLIHLEVHTSFRSTRKFNELSEDIKTVHSAHIFETMKMLMPPAQSSPSPQAMNLVGAGVTDAQPKSPPQA